MEGGFDRKQKSMQLKAKNFEIICEALENYGKTDLFSKKEVEETFWKVQALWEKAKDIDESLQSAAKEKVYLAIIEGFEGSNLKLVEKNEIKHINYHGEDVDLYELASEPLQKEEAKKLGLKFRQK